MANRYVYQAHAQDSSTGSTLANAQVEVFDADTSTQATIYSDYSGTALANPFSADSNGYLQFYAGSGRYDIVVSSGGNSQTFEDVALGPAESLDGIPSPASARTALQLNNVRNVSSYSQTEADSRFVNASGDGMTGPLDMENSDSIQDAGNNAIEFDGSGNVTLPNNLTIGGTTTSVNTTNLSVEDPLTKLANGNTTDAIDVGFIAQRLSDNVAIFWDESQDEFALALTSDDGTVTTVTISDYADLHVGGLAADDTITQGGENVLDDSDLAANGGTVVETDQDATITANLTWNVSVNDLRLDSFDGTARIAMRFKQAGADIYDLHFDGAAGMAFRHSSGDTLKFESDGGLTVGGPAGGSQGLGTISAEEFHQNGTQVFDVTQQISATNGDVLTWNNTSGEWEPQASGGGGGGGASELSDLSDVDTTGETDGDVLIYDSSAGEYVPVSSGMVRARISSTGIKLEGPSGWTVSKNGTGDYRITHGTGNSGFGIIVTASSGRLATVNSEASTYFDVETYLPGGTQSDAFFTILADISRYT